MTDTIFLEKAELQQLLRWMGEIENCIQFIDNHVEEESTYEILDECTKIRKILNKMRGFLVVIRD
jgi:hypothetical protein